MIVQELSSLGGGLRSPSALVSYTLVPLTVDTFHVICTDAPYSGHMSQLIFYIYWH